MGVPVLGYLLGFVMGVPCPRLVGREVTWGWRDSCAADEPAGVLVDGG